MIRSSDCPRASLCVKPNMRSAAGFHSVILPLSSEMMIASPTAATSCSKSMAVCMEAVRIWKSCCSRRYGARSGRRTCRLRKGKLGYVERYPPALSNSLDLAQVEDLLLTVSEARQHLLCVLAQQRRSRDF